MIEREKLYTALSRAAWAYLFIYFDFNLGTMSILPAWVGGLMLLKAIDLLKEERRDLALLKPLGWLLAIWSFLSWLFTIGGAHIDGHILFLDLIITAASLYFHFQLFTDLAAIAARYQGEGEGLDKRLLACRTADALFSTAIQLMFRFLSGQALVYATLLAGLGAFILLVSILTALFALRKLFAPEPERPPETKTPTEQ